MKLRFKHLVPMVTVAGVLLCSPPSTAAVPEHLQKSATLIRDGEYAGALEELDGLLAIAPDDVFLLRLKGVCLMELDRTHEATGILTRAVGIAPDSVACRFYLAQALASVGNIADALVQLQQVQQIAPESPYAARAAAAIPRLEQIAATSQVPRKPRRWTFCLRAAGELDDNVAARSSATESDGVNESWREVASAYLELRPLDQRAGKLPLTIGAYVSGYGSWHEESTFADYDLVIGTGAAFVRHSGAFLIPYRFDLTASYTDVTLGDDPYSTTESAALGLELRLARRAVFAPFATRAEKDFENDTTSPELYSRDGVDVAYGADQYFYLFGNKLTFGLGYEYREMDAVGDQFDIESHNGRVIVQLRLPLRFQFKTRVSYSEEDYLEYTPDPKRVDDSWKANGSLSRPLFCNWLTGEVSYTYETSKSTVEFSDYERSVTGVSLRATF